MAVVVAAAIAYVVFSGPADITLTASTDNEAYAAGGEITLTLELTNAGEKEVCVSDMVEGNIRIVSLTRDGAEVATRSAPVSFITSLSLLLEKSLTALAPGESLTISMISWVDPGLGENAFRTVSPANVGSVAVFYGVGSPGEYRLVVAYDYPGGSSPDCPRVFKKGTNQAEILFTVTPQQ